MPHESSPTGFVAALQLGWKQQRHLSLQETRIFAAQMRRCFAWWEEDEKQEPEHSGRPICLLVEGTLAALVASENVGKAIAGSMRRSQMRHFEFVLNTSCETLFEITCDSTSAVPGVLNSGTRPTSSTYQQPNGWVATEL